MAVVQALQALFAAAWAAAISGLSLGTASTTRGTIDAMIVASVVAASCSSTARRKASGLVPAVRAAGTSIVSPSAAASAPILAISDASARMLTLIFDLVVTDNDGATSTANSVTITVEGPPSAAITGVPVEINGPVGFDVTITFSKNVTGFVASDITISGGSVDGLIPVGPSVYTATISASGTGDLVISVPVDVAQDSAGNGNEASGSATSTNIIVDNTQGQVADFLQTKAVSILNTTPDLTDFLNGGFNGATRNLAVSATDGDLYLSFGGSLLNRASSKNYSGKVDVWGKVLATHSEAGTSAGDFIIGYLGAHRFVSENFLVGAMIQGDYGTESDSAAGSSGSGRGFMLGPYFAGAIGNTGLRFAGQARWGRSFNNVSPLGTYTDGYRTERLMARARLEGSFDRGDWTITPHASIAYTPPQGPARPSAFLNKS